MSILKVTRLGHPVLRALSRPVTPAELASPEIQQLIDDMVETMYEYDGVGLAAPQVHVGLRLAVLEVPETDDRAREAVPLTVLVNPEITPIGDDRELGWEGCLSIPELRGQVPRWSRLRLSALDRDGKPYTCEAAAFHARVVQHECDHLDGRVYLDRMDGLRTLSYQRELERHTPSQEPPRSRIHFGAAAGGGEEEPRRSGSPLEQLAPRSAIHSRGGTGGGEGEPRRSGSPHEDDD